MDKPCDIEVVLVPGGSAITVFTHNPENGGLDALLTIARAPDGGLLLGVNGDLVWSEATGPIGEKPKHNPHDFSSWRESESP